MKRTIHTITAALCFVLAALQGFSQGTIVTTEHGFRLVNHTNKTGTKAKAGETALVQVSTFVGDSLMGSTRITGGAREVKIPTKEQMPARVPPLFDALVTMTAGDSVTIYQPIDSMIRNVIPEALKKETEVRYEVQLLKITTQEELDKLKAESVARMDAVKTQTEALAKDFREGKLAKKLQKTASGLQYMIHSPGKGDMIKPGTAVKAHYYGALSDGTMFDTSFDDGQKLPFTAGIGQMIPGFDEGAQLLRSGGTATLFIPYALAYGEEGTPGGPIPPKADLIFYIEVSVE